jgi:predicted nucleic acid-binding protein
MSGLTYDSGALIAAEQNERRMWLIHARALARGVQPTVPAGALAEVYRSGRQANLRRLLAGCRIEALDEDRAKAAGLLLARCAVAPGAVDASVAECALRRGDAVVTGNPADLSALADGAGRKLALIAI